MSRAKAIANMCKQCIYDPIGGNGTWRQQVEACTSTGCPLFAYRPLPNYETEEQRAKRIAKQEASI